jgi:predicted SAM-dependent methyltransferase
MPEQQPLMVNLGCGPHFHRSWTNYDLHPNDPAVKHADFLNGVPLADESAQVVYHSHVLEHLPLDSAKRFLRECRRILIRGGIVRIVVPDFEQSARDYIAILDRRRRGEDLNVEHEWMLVELMDQMVRTRPGGQFSAMLAKHRDHDDFILPRIGNFGKALADECRKAQTGRSRMERMMDRLEKYIPGTWGTGAAQAMFRSRGEHHLWMYDELFLFDVLRETGFTDTRRHTHTTSSIPNWNDYLLDADSNGVAYKGVSLYVEARRA